MKMAELGDTEGFVMPAMVTTIVDGKTPEVTTLMVLVVGLVQLSWLLRVQLGEVSVNSLGKVTSR